MTPRDSVTTSTGITQRSSSPNIPPSPAKARDLSIIPRRFHLKKSASATFPYASSPSGGIQKRKKGQKPDIAVFVERAKEGLKRQKSSLSTESIADSQALREATDISVPTTQIHTQTSQKRPNASAVEKQWRAQQWGQKALQRIPVDPPKSENFPESDARDHVSLQLAEELQQFALQHTNGDRPAEPIKPTSNLKYQPKVPAQRHRDTQLQSTAVADKDSEMEIVDDAEDEGEYVYDTYTRQPSKPDTVHYDLENMHLVSGLDEDNAKIGVLVITEEDQEIWEAYAEDDDSDKDWNSEEEDENGTSHTCYPFGNIGSLQF